MKKELVIQARLEMDQEAFKRGAKQAQDALNNMYERSRSMSQQRDIDQKLRSLGYGGLPGFSKQQADQESRRYRQEEEKYLTGKLRHYSNLLKGEADLLKALKEENKTKEEMIKLDEKLKKNAEERKKTEGEIATASGRAWKDSPIGKIVEGFKSGNIGGLIRGIGGALGLSPLAMTGIGLAGTAAFKMGSGLVGDYAQRPVSLSATQGAAMQGFLGRQLQQMQTGEFAFEGGMFGGERQRAIEAARSTRRRTEWGSDILGLLNPFSERSRAKMFDQPRYQAMLAEEEAANTQKAFEGLKGQNVFTKDAVERLKRTLQRDISTQRTLGLADKGYLGEGGYLQSVLRGGFSEEMGIQATSGILAAGGSTAMARDPLSALRMQRGLNLTNAPQLLGQLSGAAGMPESSKSMLIEIFSTAQAIGLDKSKYAEENRKFMEQVTEVVSKSGIGTEAGAKQISESLADFLFGGKTMKEIERGRSAYEAYQQATTATSGFQGAVNMASALKNQILMKAVGGDVRTLETLTKSSEADLLASPEFVKALATRAGVTPEKLLREISKVRMGSLESQELGVGGAREDLKDKLKKHLEAGGTLESFKMDQPAAAPFISAISQLTGKNIQESTQFAKSQLIKSLREEEDETAEKTYGPTPMTPYRAKLEESKKKALAEARGVVEGEAPVDRDLDKIIAESAKQASFSLKTLSERLDDLTRSLHGTTEAVGATTTRAREFEAAVASARQHGMRFSRSDEADVSEIVRKLATGQELGISERVLVKDIQAHATTPSE